MTTEQIRRAYNQVAPHYAAVNTVLAEPVVAVVECSFHLIGHDASILGVACGACLSARTALVHDPAQLAPLAPESGLAQPRLRC
jgi:hypothetical protein